MSNIDPLLIERSEPSKTEIKRAPRTPKGRRNMAWVAIGTAIAVTAVAAPRGSDNPKPAPVKQGVECVFSEDTVSVTVPKGLGEQALLTQISGVEIGTCMNSAEQIVQGLNPGLDVNTPQHDQVFIIPDSVTVVSGDQIRNNSAPDNSLYNANEI